MKLLTSMGPRRNVLLFLSTVIFFPLSAAADVIDNTDAGFSTTGTWSTSVSVSGYYGSDYLYAATGDGSTVATWNYTVGSAGTYEISARWVAANAPWRATNATYGIYNNGTLLGSVSKDQTTAGGQFNLLGAYSLSAGTLEVKLTNAANNNYVTADAIEISGSSSSNAAPNGTIDSP